LARDGLRQEAVDPISTSKIKDKAHILAIISDCKKVSKPLLAVPSLSAYVSATPSFPNHKAWDFVQDIGRDYRSMLTIENIKRLHAIAMRSSRFLPNLGDHDTVQADPRNYKYVNVGETRTTTNTTMVTRRDDVTFPACPFRDVDAELSYLCKLTEVRSTYSGYPRPCLSSSSRTPVLAAMDTNVCNAAPGQHHMLASARPYQDTSFRRASSPPIHSFHRSITAW
jgi:hypothetical protein